MPTNISTPRRHPEEGAFNEFKLTAFLVLLLALRCFASSFNSSHSLDRDSICCLCFSPSRKTTKPEHPTQADRIACVMNRASVTPSKPPSITLANKLNRSISAISADGLSPYTPSVLIQVKKSVPTFWNTFRFFSETRACKSSNDSSKLLDSVWSMTDIQSKTQRQRAFTMYSKSGYRLFGK